MHRDSKRLMLNTTISKEVLDEFRNYCKEIGCPMNIVLETFMRQFCNGDFYFKLGKDKREIEVDE